MNRLTTAAAILVALILTGCSSGPGDDCDPCAAAEAQASAPFGEAAAAAAKGGMTASNQPQQQDPGARQIHTPISRGAGDQNVTTATEESRSQAGAPSVNQGLVLPTEASASTGGGVSPVVASLQGYIDDLRTQLKLAIMQGDSELEQRLSANIDRAISQMAQAQASSKGVTNNTYNFDGARIVQSVANGSNSGDGQTAIDPAAATAIAEPLSKAAAATMAAEVESKTAPAGADAPSSPAVPPAPPLPIEGGQ